MDTHDTYITISIRQTILKLQRFCIGEEDIFGMLSSFSYEGGIELEEHIFRTLLDKTVEQKESWEKITTEITVKTTISYGDYYNKKHNYYYISLHFPYSIEATDPGPYWKKISRIRFEFHNFLMEWFQQFLGAKKLIL